MQKVYKLSILYYLAFTLLLIASAIMLFENKIGFSATSVLRHYLGSEEKFIPAKGYIGVLKIILPHIFVFGLLSMVLLHFLVFTTHKYKKSTTILIISTYTIAILEMFSPFAILSGFEFFAYVKIFSFLGFLTLTVYISWLLFQSITKDN